MTTPSPLTRHIDRPDDRHRLTLRPDGKLRCHDCHHTLLLPAPTAPGQSTSTFKTPLPIHDTDRCPEHVGQRASTCGPCRAEQLEATRVTQHQPTANVAAGAAAARAALRRARPVTDDAARTGSETTP